MVMGPAEPQRYADAIAGLLDADTLVVVSSDLSHYLPYDQATAMDKDTIRHILDRDMEFLADHPDRACGTIPLTVLTRLALDRNWTPVLLHYSNSGDTAGPKDRVVGYAAIAYFENASPPLQILKGNAFMEKEHGEILLKLARKTIADRLRLPFPDDKTLAPALADPSFSAPRGTFVTLTKHHQLRGCIGNLSADKPIRDGVRENALHAAFDDPRFPALSKDEFKDIVIEISLLTEPQKLDFKDSADLLARLRPGVDGVILRKGPYSATFLPQVWDQLPDKAAFLSHLCAKAGLSSDEWRRPGLDVRVYQVQYFEEAPH
jgi:AmmeMemoRadiSam system protein A